MSEFELGVIGLGKMGQCIVEGMIQAGKLSPKQIGYTVRGSENSVQAGDKLKLKRVPSTEELVRKSSTILLAVKPQNLHDVLAELSPKLVGDKTIITIVASIPIAHYLKTLGSKAHVVRAMPNTPVIVGEGITAVALAQKNENDLKITKNIFESVGKMVVVDEKQMDAVTGLSGCGPAYVFLILEALADAGIKVGLSRELATLLATQTVLGSSKMLMETGKHPAALKDEVTTPAGCTIDGLLELEEGKVRISLIKAVVQATKRARILAKRLLR